jgi:hypothetical protein
MNKTNQTGNKHIFSHEDHEITLSVVASSKITEPMCVNMVYSVFFRKEKGHNTSIYMCKTVTFFCLNWKGLMIKIFTQKALIHRIYLICWLLHI